MKYVYSFSEGNKDMKVILGGKGANLAEMTSIGLPVPKGFTISTDACKKYYEDNQNISDEIIKQIMDKIHELESATSKKFGDKNNPLLVSVRSGASISMPGMMDTILNLGLNDEVAESFSINTDNPRFVYDSYRRFIQMYADVVMGFPKDSFERAFDKIKEEKGKEKDTDFTADELKEIVEIYKSEYLKHANTPFPQDPHVQLIEAVKAVFRSWNNDRAIYYRKLNDISDLIGTAVNVQEMVYGNSGDTSGTGVAFTRNPATGENKLYGEYLINAQGEDVVSGVRTPQAIETLKDIMPECYNQFVEICKILEEHYRDMQDMEFTIEKGKLYMLQTRSGKRTAQAAIKIAVDLVNEKMITKEEAILRVDAKSLDQLLHKTFDSASLNAAKVIAKGLAASPGSATGKIYFTARDVIEAHQEGNKDIILVRLETSPEDIDGMHIANGVLTVRGGMTSHAAVVARGMGTCCVSGCSEITVDEEKKELITKNGDVYHEGDYISLDGSTGNIYGTKIKTVEPEISGDFETFMKWVDEIRVLGVRCNADTPKDAMTALKFGAEGIGLCRTEHMFFEPQRIFSFRKMITASTTIQREKALEEVLPFQRSDFEELFRVMNGYTVTIRFLDPPLHEFLPHTDLEIQELASSLGMTFDELKSRIESLKEFNPMMGHRGCRLAVTYPEIAKMQTRAVIEALINVRREGVHVDCEIMIPLIGDIKELKYVKNIICTEADRIINETNVEVEYHIGTMIEVPRAVVIADDIAKNVDFFSFGTNDLTQLTYGFSRDDSPKFLNDYYDKKIFDFDPFVKIDQTGVGELVRIGVLKGKMIKPDLKLGICGEHGGDPTSIEFCHKLGLTYVSCSPYRIPIARVAAAQASIREKTNK